MSFKDNNDPVLFDGPAFEHANMTVLQCRKVMEQTGMTTEATRLTGLEVTDRNMANVALEILNKMKTSAKAEYARQLAVESVQRALAS